MAVVAYPVCLIEKPWPFVYVALNLQVSCIVLHSFSTFLCTPNSSYIMNSTLITCSSVYLSCLLRSFSKKLFTFLASLTLAATSAGVKPSVYNVFPFNNCFNLVFASLNIGANKAVTPNLYQRIDLAFTCSHLVKTSSFTKASTFKCMFKSDIGLCNNSAHNVVIVSLNFFGASLLYDSHFEVASPSYDIGLL